MTLAEARAAAPKVDWASAENAPHTPSFTGVKAYEDFPLEEVVPYIDWNPFFQVWQLRGRYPNRGYPKIFKDEAVGPEARKLFEEAQAMLKVPEGWVEGCAVQGPFPGRSGELQGWKATGALRGCRPVCHLA